MNGTRNGVVELDLIARLEDAKQTSPARWLSRCPAHEDKSPSLSVRQCDDGTWLLHCFAGCEPLAICRAIGVEFRDLFPARQIRRIEHRDQPRLSAADALEAIDHELTVATLILHDALEQRAIDSETWERLAIARARIGSARALTVRT